MSSLRPDYSTTGADRAERHKKRSEERKNGGSSNQNKTDASDLSTDSKSKGGINVDGQISIDSQTIDICDSCKKSPGPEKAIAICRLCSDLICSECIPNLQLSTFVDIEKSSNLLFFCNDCIDTVSNKIRKIHEGKSVASIGSATSELRTAKSVQQAPGDAESHEPSTPLDNEGNAVGQPEAPNTQGQSQNQIEPDTITSLVNAIKDLQVEMCNIKNSLAPDRKMNKPENTASQVVKQPAAQSYANAARDENAPPAIVVYDDSTNVLLQGRELAPRATIPSEIIEERDRERRKYNIIVQNLSESMKESPEDRKKEDIMEVRCMLAGMQLTEIEVKAAVRLGKKGDKPRSLMVTLDSPREAVLRRAKMIRRYRCWLTVFIDPDRTPKEQDEHKKLREEFKRRKDNGENIVMRDGKILQAGRRRSYLDLDALISQAEQRKESTADLINLASNENLTQQATPNNADDKKNEGSKEPESKREEARGSSEEENRQQATPSNADDKKNDSTEKEENKQSPEQEKQNEAVGGQDH